MVSFETVTALTLGGIVAILTLYFLIVYKKGWLKGESKTAQSYYLCPSQKCRKVFKKPVWLTDLSRTPPESYQACPHCGMNVQAVSSGSLATAMSETTTKQPLVAGNARTSKDKLHFARRETTANKPEQDSGLVRATHHLNDYKSQPESEDGQVHKPFFHFPQVRKDSEKMSEPSKRSGEKGSTDSQRKCSHFFGYVKTLPKNTPIPDECLWCPSIVDCLSHDQKVEAEA